MCLMPLLPWETWASCIWSKSNIVRHSSLMRKLCWYVQNLLFVSSNRFDFSNASFLRQLQTTAFPKDHDIVLRSLDSIAYARAREGDHQKALQVRISHGPNFLSNHRSSNVVLFFRFIEVFSVHRIHGSVRLARNRWKQQSSWVFCTLRLVVLTKHWSVLRLLLNGKWLIFPTTTPISSARGNTLKRLSHILMMKTKYPCGYERRHKYYNLL